MTCLMGETNDQLILGCFITVGDSLSWERSPFFACRIVILHPTLSPPAGRALAFQVPI